LDYIVLIYDQSIAALTALVASGRAAKKWPHVNYSVYWLGMRCTNRTVAPLGSAMRLNHVNMENRHKTGDDDDDVAYNKPSTLVCQRAMCIQRMVWYSRV